MAPDATHFYPNVPKQIDPFQDATPKRRATSEAGSGRTPGSSDFPIHIPTPPSVFKAEDTGRLTRLRHWWTEVRKTRRQPTIQDYVGLMNQWMENDNWLAAFLLAYPMFSLTYVGSDNKEKTLSIHKVMSQMDKDTGSTAFRFALPTKEQLPQVRVDFHALFLAFLITQHSGCKTIKKADEGGVKKTIFRGLPSHIVEWVKRIKATQLDFPRSILQPLDELADTAETAARVCNELWGLMHTISSNSYNDALKKLAEKRVESEIQAGRATPSSGFTPSTAGIETVTASLAKDEEFNGSGGAASRLSGREVELYETYKQKLEQIHDQGWINEEGQVASNPQAKAHGMTLVMREASKAMKEGPRRGQAVTGGGFSPRSPDEERVGHEWLTYIFSMYFKLVTDMASKVLETLRTDTNPNTQKEIRDYVANGMADVVTQFSDALGSYLVYMADLLPVVYDLESLFLVVFQLEWQWGELGEEKAEAIQEGMEQLRMSVLLHYPKSSEMTTYLEEKFKKAMETITTTYPVMSSDIQVVSKWLTEHRRRLEAFVGQVVREGPWVAFKLMTTGQALPDMLERDLWVTVWQDVIRGIFRKLRNEDETLCQALRNFAIKTEEVVRDLRSDGPDAFLPRPDMEEMVALIQALRTDCINDQCEEGSGATCDGEEEKEACEGKAGCMKEDGKCCFAQVVTDKRYKNLYEDGARWFIDGINAAIDDIPALSRGTISERATWIANNWVPSGAGVRDETRQRISRVGIPPVVVGPATRQSLTWDQLLPSVDGGAKVEKGKGKTVRHHYYQLYKEMFSFVRGEEGEDLWGGLPEDVRLYMDLQMKVDTNAWTCAHSRGRPGQRTTRSGSLPSGLCTASLAERENAVPVPNPDTDAFSAKVYVFEHLLPDAVFNAAAHRVFMMCTPPVVDRLKSKQMQAWIRNAYQIILSLLYVEDGNLLCSVFAMLDPTQKLDNLDGWGEDLDTSILAPFKDLLMILANAVSKSNGADLFAIMRALIVHLANLVTLENKYRPPRTPHNAWSDFYVHHVGHLSILLPSRWALDRLRYEAQGHVLMDVGALSDEEKRQVTSFFFSAASVEIFYALQANCGHTSNGRRLLKETLDLRVPRGSPQEEALHNFGFVVTKASLGQSMGTAVMAIFQSPPVGLIALALSKLSSHEDVLCHFVLACNFWLVVDKRGNFQQFTTDVQTWFQAGVATGNVPAAVQRSQAWLKFKIDNRQQPHRLETAYGLFSVIEQMLSHDPTGWTVGGPRASAQAKNSAWNTIATSVLKTVGESEFLNQVAEIGVIRPAEQRQHTVAVHSVLDSLKQDRPDLFARDAPRWFATIRPDLETRLASLEISQSSTLGSQVVNPIYDSMSQWTSGRCSVNQVKRDANVATMLVRFVLAFTGKCDVRDIASIGTGGAESFHSARAFLSTTSSLNSIERQNALQTLDAVESTIHSISTLAGSAPPTAALSDHNLALIDRMFPEIDANNSLGNEAVPSLLDIIGVIPGLLQELSRGESTISLEAPVDRENKFKVSTLLLEGLLRYCLANYSYNGPPITLETWELRCDVPYLITLLALHAGDRSDRATRDLAYLSTVISNYLGTIGGSVPESIGPVPSLDPAGVKLYSHAVAEQHLQRLNLPRLEHPLLAFYIASRYQAFDESMQNNPNRKGMDVDNFFVKTLVKLSEQLCVINPCLDLSWDRMKFSTFPQKGYLQSWLTEETAKWLWINAPVKQAYPYSRFWRVMTNAIMAAGQEEMFDFLVDPLQPCVGMVMTMTGKKWPRVWSNLVQAGYSYEDYRNQVVTRYFGKVDDVNTGYLEGTRTIEAEAGDLVGNFKRDLLTKKWTVQGRANVFWFTKPRHAEPPFKTKTRVYLFGVAYQLLLEALRSGIESVEQNGWKVVEEWLWRRALNEVIYMVPRGTAKRIREVLTSRDCVPPDVKEPLFANGQVKERVYLKMDEVLKALFPRTCHRIDTIMQDAETPGNPHSTTEGQQQQQHRGVLRVPWRMDDADNRPEAVPWSCFNELMPGDKLLAIPSCVVNTTATNAQLQLVGPPELSFDFIFPVTNISPDYGLNASSSNDLLKSLQEQLESLRKPIVDVMDFGYCVAGDQEFLPFPQARYDAEATSDFANHVMVGWRNLNGCHDAPPPGPLTSYSHTLLTTFNTPGSAPVVAYTASFNTSIAEAAGHGHPRDVTGIFMDQITGGPMPGRLGAALPVVPAAISAEPITAERRRLNVTIQAPPAVGPEDNTPLAGRPALYAIDMSSSVTMGSILDYVKRQWSLVGNFQIGYLDERDTFINVSLAEAYSTVEDRVGLGLVVHTVPGDRYAILRIGAAADLNPVVPLHPNPNTVIVNLRTSVAEFASAVWQGQLGEVIPSERRFVVRIAVDLSTERTAKIAAARGHVTPIDPPPNSFVTELTPSPASLGEPVGQNDPQGHNYFLATTIMCAPNLATLYQPLNLAALTGMDRLAADDRVATNLYIQTYHYLHNAIMWAPDAIAESLPLYNPSTRAPFANVTFIEGSQPISPLVRAFKLLDMHRDVGRLGSNSCTSLILKPGETSQTAGVSPWTQPWKFVKMLNLNDYGGPRQPKLNVTREHKPWSLRVALTRETGPDPFYFTMNVQGHVPLLALYLFSLRVRRFPQQPWENYKDMMMVLKFGGKRQAFPVVAEDGSPVFFVPKLLNGMGCRMDSSGKFISDVGYAHCLEIKFDARDYVEAESIKIFSIGHSNHSDRQASWKRDRQHGWALTDAQRRLLDQQNEAYMKKQQEGSYPTPHHLESGGATHPEGMPLISSHERVDEGGEHHHPSAAPIIVLPHAPEDRPHVPPPPPEPLATSADHVEESKEAEHPSPDPLRTKKKISENQLDLQVTLIGAPSRGYDANLGLPPRLEES